MKYLHLLFIQLTSIVSLGLNVYLYTHVVELTKTVKDKTIADKTLFEKLESKIALIPEKLLDDPVAVKSEIITQSDSVLGYVYLGVSVVVLVGLLYFLYTSYMALYLFFSTKSISALLFPLASPLLKAISIVPDKHIEVVDMHGTIIKLDIMTQIVAGKQHEMLTLSIKRAGDLAYHVIDNIGSIIVENPEVAVKALEASDSFSKFVNVTNFG